MIYPNKIDELRLLAKAHGADALNISSIVLDNPQFAEWSACHHNRGHHYGTGGLQYHTWEVAYLCETNSAYFLLESHDAYFHPMSQKVLFLAALFHDYGKIWDYQPARATQGVAWQETPHRRTVHHISRSAIEWAKAVEATNVCRDVEERVLHCILSHHGHRQFGSPVAPKSREAWVLHLCDGLSARVADADTIDLADVK